MEPSITGSFRLFRAAGVDVYLHWSWFVVAALQIWSRQDVYQAPAWKVAEYLSLFGIVLMHEFGHALACRSVGGQAERIVLWPLGGIAYVSPPPRPLPVLWSIVAGPLVNVVLAVPLGALLIFVFTGSWRADYPDVVTYLSVLNLMNALLLGFNLLPIYPLDGGQIVQALLWMSMGRWRSLQFVSILGLILGALMFLGTLALFAAGMAAALLLGVIAVFIVLRSLLAFQASHYMLRLEALPRHADCACPACGEAPPAGPFWVCEHCQSRFDTFSTRGKCPACGAWFLETACPNCHARHHIDQWFASQEILEPIAVGASGRQQSPGSGTPPEVRTAQGADGPRSPGEGV